MNFNVRGFFGAQNIHSMTLFKILQSIQQDEVACADWDALTDTLKNLLEGDGVEGTSLFTGGDSG
jgi:hypothetical protein